MSIQLGWVGAAFAAAADFFAGADLVVFLVADMFALFIGKRNKGSWVGMDE